eukprot:TRINITY_DN2546_c0_g1_i13.p1 TRINITY_DN2546_c0_g1~~TRINITY_DN2546_c0_g1_i13.p1  ORF type:complete len:248 (-),score=40.79 TRINITY_DN2546_c0_g1_i13:159-902(-)
MSKTAPLELTTFQEQECYVYQIPPASSLGHRAELWDVNNWIREVSCQIVTQGEDCFIRLFDKETSQLFAECPIDPNVPFHASVEQVVDSSRYFVIKIVDRDSKRHAFIGIGFRERSKALNFNAALDDHRQYLRRKKEAEKRLEELAKKPHVDYSLKEGEKIEIKVGKGVKQSKIGDAEGGAKIGEDKGLKQKLGVNLFNSEGKWVLPPPPGQSGNQQYSLQPQLSGINTDRKDQQEIGDDDFGDFVS